MPGGIDLGGEPAHRRIDVPRLGEDARPDQRPGPMGLEDFAERVERARVHDEVGIRDEHPFGRSLHPRQGGQAAVDAGPVPEVAPRTHEVHGWVRTRAEHLAQRGLGAARLSVLDHDDRTGAVGQERANAAVQEGTGVVVDHHRPDRTGHRCLSSPW